MADDRDDIKMTKLKELFEQLPALSKFYDFNAMPTEPMSEGHQNAQTSYMVAWQILNRAVETNNLEISKDDLKDFGNAITAVRSAPNGKLATLVKREVVADLLAQCSEMLKLEPSVGKGKFSSQERQK